MWNIGEVWISTEEVTSSVSNKLDECSVRGDGWHAVAINTWAQTGSPDRVFDCHHHMNVIEAKQGDETTEGECLRGALRVQRNSGIKKQAEEDNPTKATDGHRGKISTWNWWIWRRSGKANFKLFWKCLIVIVAVLFLTEINSGHFWEIQVIDSLCHDFKQAHSQKLFSGNTVFLQLHGPCWVIVYCRRPPSHTFNLLSLSEWNPWICYAFPSLLLSVSFLFHVPVFHCATLVPWVLSDGWPRTGVYFSIASYPNVVVVVRLLQYQLWCCSVVSLPQQPVSASWPELVFFYFFFLSLSIAGR